MGKRFFLLPSLLLIILLSGYVLITYYEFIFARTVSGVVEGVERVTNPQAFINTPGAQNTPTAEQLYSFAIAIKQKDGEIVTASTEDRQWAVAQKGKCVEAKIFPYPPWNFDKAGTYHGARLLRLFDCESAAGQSTH